MLSKSVIIYFSREIFEIAVMNIREKMRSDVIVKKPLPKVIKTVEGGKLRTDYDVS